MQRRWRIVWALFVSTAINYINRHRRANAAWR
jgi:hypothetical protein